MKRFVFLVLLVFSFLQVQNLHAEGLHAPFDAVLKKYVSHGYVKYGALKSDRAGLDAYLDSLAKISRSTYNTLSQHERLAYLINLYNAATLKLIIDNYPVKSIKDIGSTFSSPWKIKVVRYFGKLITLDNLEHDIIRREFREPRIHLALVCAARSCPPLRSEVYRGEQLSTQLDDQGQKFFNGPHGVRVDHSKKRVYLSSILKWYKEDFASVVAFAQRYSKQRFDDYKVSYLDYDWALNGR